MPLRMIIILFCFAIVPSYVILFYCWIKRLIVTYHHKQIRSEIPTLSVGYGATAIVSIDGKKVTFCKIQQDGGRFTFNPCPNRKELDSLAKEYGCRLEVLSFVVSG